MQLPLSKRVHICNNRQKEIDKDRDAHTQNEQKK